MKKASYYGLLFLFFSVYPMVIWGQGIKTKTIRFTSPANIEFEQDVYFPEGPGPFPVVLIRTPYGKQQYGTDGRFFASRGYATVIQDVRGKFGSKGQFIPFVYETEDGLATLDWITAQEWSNGKVGIYGISYSGFCGLTLSNKKHPALKSVVNFSGWVKPSTMAAPGGAQHLMLNLTWLLHEETQTKRNILDYDLDSLFYYLPLSGVFKSIGIQSEAWESPELLGQVNTNFRYEDTHVPVLHLTGAFDFVKEATLEAFTAMTKHGRANQKLIFGPWFHNQSHTSLTEVGEVDFGPRSLFGDEQVRQLALDWLNTHVKNQKIATSDSNQVFLMFDNQWYDFSTWPPEEAKLSAYFLSSQQEANSASGDGRLTKKQENGRPWDAYTYDPARPVPTNGGANFHFFPAQLGIKDQSDLEKRKDILVYTSPVFEREMAVIGTPEFHFYASSSTPDTDFTAKLILLAPDGMAMNISDGIIRARYRDGMERENLLKPDKVYPLKIQLGSTAFKISRGYQLRLEVSSSNFPKYNRNTNTEEDSFFSASFQAAQQRIYHSKEYPSKLLLPMLSMDQLNN